jgi:hypothetical protein
MDKSSKGQCHWVLSAFLLCIIILAPKTLQAATKIYKQGLKVAKMTLPVEIIDVKGESVDPSVGFSVMPGSRVRTGDGALCVLASNDGDNMTLDEETEVQILSPAFGNQNKGGSVALAQGRAHFQVQHNANFPMKVRTAVNMLTVRGTHFSTIYRDKTFRLEVLEGLVEARFFDAPDEIISTAAGKMLDARAGAKMSGTMSEAKKASMRKVKVFGDKATSALMEEGGQEARQQKERQEKKSTDDGTSSNDSNSTEDLESLYDSVSDLIQQVQIQTELEGLNNGVPIDIEFDVTSGEIVGE